MGLVIDSFAGGGGASLGIEMALGRGPDIAINHDPVALAIHKANHPGARHFCQNIVHLQPREVTGGRTVDLLWASPDCKHFSKAKGGRPRAQNIRDLPWAVVHWAQKVRPRLIILENVEEFLGWGPLDREGQPIKEKKGQTFSVWTKRLRRCGYKVEWRELRACDYGAPTIRKRLFVIARCDGLSITWPEPTHGDGLQPYHTAAECIDWSLICPSIFDSSEEIYRKYGIRAVRPLAENTLKRIAKGIKRFVIDNPDPFIVAYYGPKRDEFRGGPVDDPLPTQTTENRFGLVMPYLNNLTHGGRIEGLTEPFKTITGAHRGEKALVLPCLIHNTTGHAPGDLNRPLATLTTGNQSYLTAAFLSRQFGQGIGREADGPCPTVTAGGGGKSALVTAFLAQHNGGAVGHRCGDPLSTISSRGSQQQVVSAFVAKFKGTALHGQGVREPLHTIQAGGQHYGAVAAFLTKYYGQGIGQDMSGPAGTVTAKDRMGLVTVCLNGEPYLIADIGMRMLQPRELFRAQGFPDSYVINPDYNGKPLPKTAQVRACGNSVCPQLAEALVRANYVETTEVELPEPALWAEKA